MVKTCVDFDIAHQQRSLL